MGQWRKKMGNKGAMMGGKALRGKNSERKEMGDEG